MSSFIQEIKDNKALHRLGFTTEKAKEILKALKDKNVSSLSLSAADLKEDSAEAGLFIIEKLKQAPHIKDVSFDNKKIYFNNTVYRASDLYCSQIVEKIHETQVSSLDLFEPYIKKLNLKNLKHLSIQGHLEKPFDFSSLKFEKSALNSLSFGKGIMTDSELGLMKNLPKSLKSLTLGSLQTGTRYSKEALAETLEHLPDSLEHLQIRYFDFPAVCAESLAKRLPSMHNLKDLKISNTSMDDKTLAILEKPLQASHIETLRLLRVETDDEKINAFLDRLEQSETALSEIHIVNRYGTDFTRDMERPETLMRERQEARAEETPAELFEEGVSIRSPDVLFKAAELKRFDEVYEKLAETKEHLSVQDYLQKNADGNMLINVIAYSKQLDKVFVPENWTSAKDMQTVFDAVSDNQKYQIDGKEGRPSFMQNKNKAMQNAVKISLAGKTNQR